MTYKNFITLFLSTIVAYAFIFSIVDSTLQVGAGILSMGIIVDTLCILRLKALGFTTRQAFSKLYFHGYKFLLLFNQLK